MGKVFFLVRGKFFLVGKNIFLVDENVFLVVGAFDPYSFTDCYSSETCYIQLVTFCDNLIAFWYRHDLLRLTQELLQFPFCFFFLFFLLVTLSGWTAKSFLANVL